MRDEYTDGDVLVPTRLVLFAGGVKVDFAFYAAEAVSAGIKTGLAHRVLLDKDGAAREPRAEPVSLALRRPLSAAEFARTVEEFWFEAYHVAKYLARNELWLVKARDWATKQRLLEMIEWHKRPTQGGDPDLHDAGRNMRSWVGDETWEELQRVFAGFDREESWGTLLPRWPFSGDSQRRPRPGSDSCIRPAWTEIYRNSSSASEARARSSERHGEGIWLLM